MNDYYRIKAENGQALRPEDIRAAHLRSRQWLEAEMAARKSAGEKAVVITHHGPSRKSVSEENLRHELAPAYIKDMDYLIERYEPALWIHGHTHYSARYRLGKTLVAANQRGYQFQRDQRETGFSDLVVCDI
jgi:hypothetical protein